jgi:ATP-dependent DNA ligase
MASEARFAFRPGRSYLPAMSSLSSRTRSVPAGFIEPCLPSPADNPPSGSNWIHEIKHDGYRLMARRDPLGIRLLTRRGNDWASRFPPVVEAVNHLKVRSCLIDGEVMCCDERGLARFDVLRRGATARRERSFTPSICSARPHGCAEDA